jgi:hypothetical protein
MPHSSCTYAEYKAMSALIAILQEDDALTRRPKGSAGG